VQAHIYPNKKAVSNRGNGFISNADCIHTRFPTLALTRSGSEGVFSG